MQTTNYLMYGYDIIILDIIVYSIIVLTVMLWYISRWRARRFEKIAASMNGPPSYPIVGSWLNFIGTPNQMMNKIIKLAKEYGPQPFKVWLGSELVIVMSKPEDLQVVLNNSNALTKHPIYGLFNNLLGDGLFSAPIHKWKTNRRIISPLVNTNAMLRQFFSVFNEKNQILINNLQKELGKTQMFDLWDYIANTTLDTICQTTMGYNLKAQSNSQCEFAHALIKITEENTKRFYHPWLYPDIIFSIYEKLTGLHDVYNTLNKIPNQVIKEMKETYSQMRTSNKMRHNANDTDEDENHSKFLLGRLLELNESGENFTDKQLRDEVMTMLIAGTETSAITDCFCLLLLAMYPDIQNKVYDEIYSIFGDTDETITIEETTKLVYLEQVLNETLRLFPVGPVLFRLLTDDVKIASNNLILPKGTACVLHLIGTHYTPELYSNPMVFNPDNFTPEKIAQRHKYSFIPFSGGPRGCVGSKYAMISMKVLISTFLRNFSVHTEWKFSDIELKIDLVMRSNQGYPITIRPRNRRPTGK